MNITNGTIHIFAEASEMEQKIKDDVPPAPEGMTLTYVARFIDKGVAEVKWKHEATPDKPAAIYGVPAAPMPFDFIDGSGEAWRMNNVILKD